ncbi:hypothetical protein D3C85_819600 [compost metagenome]
MSNIFVIPDTQCRPGDDFEYLTNIGRYIVDKRPDVIVHLGDHWDMPSLSSYDVGKKAFEGRRYKADVQAGNEAMVALLEPLQDLNFQQRKNGKKQYRPRMVFTMGNHCNRINRAVENDPKLEGVLSVNDLDLTDWEVYGFTDVVVIDGVAFSHYFITGTAGRPASTATAQLNKKHMSCVAGHQQGLQIATASRADGKRITSVIAGSCYEHNEDYLGAQGNNHYRGALMLYDVADGEFNLVPVPIKYLNNKYGV